MNEYPYLPKEKKILFVSESNLFMKKAKSMLEGVKKDFPFAGFVTASVIAKDNVIVSKKTNRDVHLSFCPRRVFDSPSGKDYELCPRHCHPDNHSEARAIKGAGEFAKGADLYMYGHWWCCKPCWDKMIKASINNVFLVENAAQTFYQDPGARKKESPKTFFYRKEGPVSDELEALLAKVNVRHSQSGTIDFALTYLDKSSLEIVARRIEETLLVSITVRRSFVIFVPATAIGSFDSG